jgi:hypothetical protein
MFGLEVKKAIFMLCSDIAMFEPGSASPESLCPASKIFPSCDSDIPILKEIPFDLEWTNWLVYQKRSQIIKFYIFFYSLKL